MAIAVKEQFVVEAPIDRVWAYFQDPPRVVPCLPGAQLVEVIDDKTYRGKVNLQVGPVRAQFDGTVSIEHLDADAHDMTLVARGSQQGAVGRAEAKIQFGLESEEQQATQVTLVTEISISGRLAQLGGGMIQTVSRQLFRKFADCVRDEIVKEDMTGGASDGKEKGGV